LRTSKMFKMKLEGYLDNDRSTKWYGKENRI